MLWNGWLLILSTFLSEVVTAPPHHQDDHPLPRLLPQEVGCDCTCRSTNRGCSHEINSLLDDTSIDSPCPPSCSSCPSCPDCPPCPDRLAGQSCSSFDVCRPPLVCHYQSARSTQGICKEIKGLPCMVFNTTYEHGQTFMMDCRTQCACQDGRYACASLCPKENIRPAGSSCRLVDLPGQCCREWLCDSHNTGPKECQVESSPWSECSATCGSGLSRRVSNDNEHCESKNETRICQLRPCPGPLTPVFPSEHHRLRKGHECKATRRDRTALRARFASCVSRRRYRPRWCGACGCIPELSTSIQVELSCRQPEDTVEDVTLGQELWSNRGRYPLDGTKKSVPVQWIVKCSCPPKPTPETLLHRVHRTTAP